jgi:hypothetical protein
VISVTDAPAGWILIGTATIWAGKFIGALVASRGAASGERLQKWQWLAFAALQVIAGVRFITEPSPHDGIPWWLAAAGVALLTWMLITDAGLWLRSRMSRTSGQ